jgi:hypothetical protein
MPRIELLAISCSNVREKYCVAQETAMIDAAKLLATVTGTDCNEHDCQVRILTRKENN